MLSVSIVRNCNHHPGQMLTSGKGTVAPCHISFCKVLLARSSWEHSLTAQSLLTCDAQAPETDSVFCISSEVPATELGPRKLTPPLQKKKEKQKKLRAQGWDRSIEGLVLCSLKHPEAVFQTFQPRVQDPVLSESGYRMEAHLTS